MPQKLPKRGSTYYHRRVTPKDLIAALGIKERWVTLGTKDLADAKARWREVDYEYELFLREVRRRVRAGTWEYPSNDNLKAPPPPMDDATYAEVLRQSLEFSDPEVPDDDGLPYAQWEKQRDKIDRQYATEWLEEERRTTGLPLLDLFDNYVSDGRKRPETVKQFRAVVRHFIGFLGHDNALRVRKRDVGKWRDHLQQERLPSGKPRSTKTINDTYLSAVRAMFSHATDKMMMEENPARDVKPLPSDRKAQLRERDFDKAEQRLILSATRQPAPDRMAAHNAAARRWVPWLCAYTGARVNEITQLRGSDIKNVEGVWTVHITPDAGATKANKARTVPLHEHLIEQGFVDFATKQPGPLFYDPTGRRKADGRAQNKKAGNRLANWVRSLGLEEGVAPNHGWRHTFRTIAREVGIPEEAVDYIEGHAGKTQGRRYGRHNLPTVLAEISKIPRFES